MNIIFYVGVVHAFLPTQYKTLMDFSKNDLFESCSLRYICKEKQILRLVSFPSDCQYGRSQRTDIVLTAYLYELSSQKKNNIYIYII